MNKIYNPSNHRTIDNYLNYCSENNMDPTFIGLNQFEELLNNNYLLPDFSQIKFMNASKDRFLITNRNFIKINQDMITRFDGKLSYNECFAIYGEYPFQLN